MELKILNAEERRTCHNHFRKNDLFRHWHPILSEAEGSMMDMDAISVWYNADRVLKHLRACVDYRDEELNFIHSEICRNNKKENVSAIMAVVLTRLMNATQEGHEEEDIPNDVICKAILKKHHTDIFFERLIAVFFRRNIGNDGHKVVIKQTDPMTQETTFDDMDEASKSEMLGYIEKVMELTQGLNLYMKDNWENWKLLWTDICMDVELLNLLKVSNPNRNDWGLNQKMICNVVGLCLNEGKMEASINSLNKALTQKQVSSYISQPRDFDGSNSAFNKEQCDKVLAIIKTR